MLDAIVPFLKERRVMRSGESRGEAIWELPLVEEYKESLKTPYADLNNLSAGGLAGAITAGLFLREFAPDGVGWAHLDVAGAGGFRDKEVLRRRVERLRGQDARGPLRGLPPGAPVSPGAPWRSFVASTALFGAAMALVELRAPRSRRRSSSRRTSTRSAP